MTPEEQFREEMEKTLELIRSFGGNMDLTNKFLETLGANINKINARTPEALKKQQEADDALIKAEKEREHALKKGKSVVDAFSTGMGGAVNAVGSFISGLAQGRPTLTMFNQSIGALGDTAVGVGKDLGGVAQAAGYLFKGYTEGLKLQLNVNQAYLTARDSLTKLGGAGEWTAENFGEVAKQSRLTFLSLDRMIKPLQSLGAQVQVLGDNVGQAQLNFARINTYTKEELRTYARLGIMQEDLIQAGADYVYLQSLQGRAIKEQLQDQTRVRKASEEYLKSTLALAAVTGQSAEDQKKAQERLQTDQAYEIKKLELSARAVQAERAGRTGEAADIREKLRSYDNLIAALGKSGNPAAAGMLKDMIVNRGAITESNQGLSMLPGMMTFGSQLYQNAEKGAYANINVEQQAARFADKFAETFTEAMPMYATAANLDPAIAKMMGLDDPQARRTLLNTMGRQQSLEQTYLERRQSIDTLLGTPEKSPAGKAQADVQDLQYDIGSNLEKVAGAMPPLQYAMVGLIAAVVANTAAIGVQAYKNWTLFRALGGGGGLPGTGGIVAGEAAVAAGAAGAAGAGGLTAAELAAFKAARAAGRSPTEALNAARGLRGVPGAMPGFGTAATTTGELAAAGRVATTGGRLALGLGTAGLGIGGMAASYGADELRERGHTKSAAGVDIFGDVLTGAGLGAGGGALLGGVGAIPGAIAGGVGGLLYGIGRWGKQLLGTNEAVEESKEQQEELQKVLPKLVDSANALDKAFKLLAQTTMGMTSGQTGTTPAAGAAAGAAPTAGATAGAGQPAAAANSAITKLGMSLQSQGYRVSENPAFGGVTPGVHKGAGHADGRAIDINVGTGFNEAQDPTYGPIFDQMANQLRGQGFKVLWRTTGHYDHMHVEQPAGAGPSLDMGGMVSGSSRGYPATLHGNEIVVPLNPNSLLVELGQKSRQEIQDINQTLNIKNSTGEGYKEILGQNQNLMSMLSDKLDKVITHLDESNSNQTKLLRYAST